MFYSIRASNNTPRRNDAQIFDYTALVLLHLLVSLDGADGDGSWYSYVRKYYVNKTENTNIFLEYSTYVIDTAAGYEDNVQTICSFQMPEFDANMNRVEAIETEINGMYGLMTGTTIAWADLERHVVYKLYSKDVTGEELLKVAQSICSE